MKQQLPNAAARRSELLFSPASQSGKPFTWLMSMGFILLLFFSTHSNAQGTWTKITNNAPDANGGGMLLLSDGSVLVKTFSGGGDGIGNIYDKLTPNKKGSYIHGTWTTIAAMHSTRLYYSSQVLKDGRVYVAGGEYGSGYSLGETYDPLTDAWTDAPAPGTGISDANSEILPDGRVLQALVSGDVRGTDIFDPVANTYTTGATALGVHNESAWVKLPDNSILFVDIGSTSSERYIPSLNQWISDATVPVALYDPYGYETGAALLLPDGRAFFLGSTGHTAYYTPSGSTSQGSWAAGPDIPGGKGTPDAPAAMMVNGKILCSVSPAPTSGDHFPSPTSFYEFDYLTNSFTSINTPLGGSTINEPSYVTGMLDLPDGSVLYAEQDNNQYYVYAPDGTPVASGKPTISTFTQNGCTSNFTLTGTLFNGLSEGAAYGDDWQMASNYPIVRLTNGLKVYYARTYNWNSTGVHRGSLPDTTQLTLPSGLPAATYSLVVVANGIASDPISFTPLSATITPLGNLDICSAGSVTLQANSGSYSFQWKKGNSNLSGATNLYYTAGNTGTYKVTVTNGNGCSATSKGVKVTKSCKENTPLNDLIAGEMKLYPNPSEGETTIQFAIPQASHVYLKVYDLDGQEKETLLNDDLERGNYSLTLNTNHFSTGVYIVRIFTEAGIENVKLVVQ